MPGANRYKIFRSINANQPENGSWQFIGETTNTYYTLAANQDKAFFYIIAVQDVSDKITKNHNRKSRKIRK